MRVSRARYHEAFVGLSIFLMLLAGIGPALAQRSIGSATSIERTVSGTLAGRVRNLSAGNGVFSNETIRTANASAAQLQFLDQTRLRIGPSAAVVLNRFIYNPDRTVREGAVTVSTGAARWVGGTSPPDTHEVTTPHAVIGVRGTVFDVLVETRRTIVTLHEGVIEVCPIAARQRCVTLSTPGQTVIVTPTTISGPTQGPSSTRFADLCLQPIDRAACMYTTTALLTPLPTWAGFYGGVHGGYANNRARVVTGGTDSVTTSIGVGNVAAFLDPRGEGPLAGVQVGYSWQIGLGVFGLEADISGVSARARQVSSVSPFGVVVTTTAEQNVDVLGTLRARAGLAFDNFLVFGTGGLAVGHIELLGSIAPIPVDNPTYVGARSLVKAGYAFGGGVEYAFDSGVTIRAEYLHYDLGTQGLFLNETTGLLPAEFATMQFRTRGDIVRAAANFRF